MPEYQNVALETCLSALIDYRGKSPPKSPTGIPVISAKVVKAGRLLPAVEQKIAPEYYPVWMTRGLPQVGDVVLTTEGPLGEVAQLDAESARYALGQRVVVLRGRSGVLDNTFLRFLLQSPRQQQILASFATGTTVEGISQKALRAVPLSLPDFPTQLAIAAILSALDDKIDLNRRMSETLEAMARAIFKDWFVDFGPVRAKAERRQPPGLAPDIAALFPDALDDDDKPVGWSLADVYEVSDVVYGAPFASGRFNTIQRGLPLIRIRDLSGHSPGIFTDEQHPKATIIEAGDIVVGMDGEFRLHIWRGPRALLNQRVCSFRPKHGVPASFLAESLKEPLAYFERGKVGTTVIHLGKSDIDTFHFFLPPEPLLRAYGNITDPLIARYVANAGRPDH